MCMGKRHNSYQYFSWIVAVHADGEVIHSQRNRLGVGHGFVPAPVLILDQCLEWQQVTDRTLDRLGKYVGARALEVIPTAIKRSVVRVPSAFAGCIGQRVAVSDATLQGTLFTLLTASRFANDLGKIKK